MTTYNRGWLDEQIASYLHDESVGPGVINTWIDLGAKRVSQVLQCYEMEGELTRPAGDIDNFLPLPSAVRHVLGVQWQTPGGSYMNLRSVPRHNAGQYKRDGQPGVYLIQDRNIYPLPWSDSNYRAQVVNEVTIPADYDTETPALTAYPFVFLSAALAEAYDWKQNQEMLVRYETKWRDEAAKVTNLYLSERVGDTPAMRAM